MNATKITAGALVALTGVALTAVVAANPFSTQASSIQAPPPVHPQVVGHLQVVEDEEADSDAQTKPYIGVAISSLSPARAEELGVDGGVMVTAVLNESPSSGVLEHGDVITSIDGQVVSSRKDVMYAVMASSVGDVISVIVIRGDDTLDLSVAVGETDISKRDIFRSRVAQMHKPNLTQGLIQKAFQAGDRFARGEVVIADENGVYQTYRATAGLVTEIDSDAKTFTLQPKDGSALIEYMISDDAKVNLNRTGDLGELNTEANTLVVDVNGEVKQVHQGEMSKPYMQGKGHGPNIQMHRGQSGQQGRIGREGQGGHRQGGQFGFGQGFGNFNQSGLPNQIRDRLPFFGANRGPGDLSDFLSPEVLEKIEQFGRGELHRSDFLSEICESLDQENLPERIIIRCETSDEAPATPAVDDNSL